ncbi:MAG: hypothetical protein HC914_07575 [Chloroflexaceae bacterium]|nr:hypothetical protein [Chloroflexaceae bacterium]
MNSRLAAGLAGVALPLALLMLYNYQLFGNPLTSGYGGLDPSSELGVPWQEGLIGLTIGTGKGLLLYSPVVLLGLAGVALRWRQQWREALLAVLMLAVHLAFYSRLNYWHGDGSWGPRYMVFVVPFVLLPAAGLLAVLAAHRHRLAIGLTGAVVVVSFCIQLLPVLVNYNTYIALSDQYARLFFPSASPILHHTRIAGERIQEWLLHYIPPRDTVVLREGFSYSEGDRAANDMLPRWTYGAAQMQVYPTNPEAPVSGRLVVGDHRPWPLERAQFQLLLNGQPLEGVERTDLTGQNIMWELRFQLSPEQARSGALLTLQSDTWNPTRDTQDNPRNEDLGLLIETIEIEQNGAALAVREALPIPSTRPGRRDLWLWYYDSPYHHLVDTWWWYVMVSGLPVGMVVLLLLLIGGPGLAMMIIGLRGVTHAERTTAATPAAPERVAALRLEQEQSGNVS